MKVFPNTHYKYETAPRVAVSLIISKIKETKDISIRALVGCVLSKRFVRRQSLKALRITFVERMTPHTRMKVRLATGT